jgi:hypothetical protein
MRAPSTGERMLRTRGEDWLPFVQQQRQRALLPPLPARLEAATPRMHASCIAGTVLRSGARGCLPTSRGCPTTS